MRPAGSWFCKYANRLHSQAIGLYLITYVRMIFPIVSTRYPKLILSHYCSMIAKSLVITLVVWLTSLHNVMAQSAATTVIAGRAELTEVVEEIPLTGTVMSTMIAQLSTEISGLIGAIKVDIGDQINAGDEILTLDDDMQLLSLKAKEAETEQAREELADARRRLKDAKALGRNQTVSANEIKSLAAEVQIDGIVVKRLLAEEQQQALRLKKHRLTAPFGGIISQKLVEQGEWVVPGQAVAELVNTDELRIEFQVPQAVYSRLDQLVRLTLRLDAVPDEQFDARIVAIVPVTDRSSRTFLVRAQLTDDNVKLIPGLSASAIMMLKTATSGVVIHRNALLRYPDGRVTVWVVEENDGQFSVSEKQVETGLSFNGRINITSGLDANALVVIEGNESLREGQAVSVRRPGD